MTAIALLVSGFFNSTGGGLKAPAELLTGVDLQTESYWMGVYLNQSKIGYIHHEIEPLRNGNYEIREFSSLEGAMMGAFQQMRMRMTIITDSTFALVSFKGRVEAEPYTTLFNGWIENKVLTIEVTTGGKKTDKFLPAPEPIYLSQAIKPLLQAGRLDDGDSLKLAGFDPMTIQMQEMVVIGAPLQEHKLWGENVMARKLTTRLSGFESEVYVDESGDSVAEFGPLGMLMRRESREKALQVEEQNKGVDFLAIYAIKPKGKLRAPRKVNSADYRVTGFDLNKIEQASNRQKITDAENKMISVSSESFTKQSNLNTDLGRFISEEPFIESRNKRILATAERVTKGASSRSDSLALLSDYVFHAVKKKPSAGIPSALAVLNRLEGDCNEHSVLFTALARSLNIPTRIQMGVVYQQNKFFYHAWVASLIDGQWVEFDPTFGQVRADAARIALTSGSLADAVNLVSAIEKMEIEIVEFTNTKSG